MSVVFSRSRRTDDGNDLSSRDQEVEIPEDFYASELLATALKMLLGLGALLLGTVFSKIDHGRLRCIGQGGLAL
ncbi:MULTISPECIES: hypothetical protein [Mesorhizobium]|uniref:Uncharacterized protein n=1 Tax=Mesorhizobium qingshengii TaxID=1165689 RepID=A0A1G5ZVS3_9HYPH|nr:MULTISPECIES: hypothetical protein [Mesorhizobium]MCH4560560.1 hypothetical protein [Mesorhizobium jarvisii]SDA98888.1 hypothetical protein SAMN02927914_06370 [Mesorhizobium qingshengii]